MKRAVIITGHFPFQKRRGSILWVSHHLQKMGWHVTHVTVGYSWLSHIKTDQRLLALGYKPKQGQHIQSNTLTTIYGLSPLHPVRSGRPFADKILSSFCGLFTTYWGPKLRKPLAVADLVICESGAPVLLAPLISKYAPRAARIYRVNDDIHLLNAPDYLLDAEVENQHHFTRISSANQGLTKRFSHKNVTLDPMGIPCLQVAKTQPSPFHVIKNQKVAVCAGTTQLDHRALIWIAKNRPNWQVHVLGRTKGNLAKNIPNLIYHGEVNFDETLGFVAHADIGLAPYIDRLGIEYQTTNSNRMLLYRHFGIPILGPDRLCDPALPSVIGYNDPNALGRCENTPKRPEAIQDWSTLAIALAQNAEIVPPTEVSYVPAMSA
jgi:2-beta-glucuronyltransferase